MEICLNIILIHIIKGIKGCLSLVIIILFNIINTLENYDWPRSDNTCIMGI